jgi:hypothetical protein
LRPPIIRQKFYKALIDLRDKKSNGNIYINELPSDVLKNLDNTTTEKIFNIITDCYKKGKIPNNCHISVALLKKGYANDCSKYRTISILSHASKILVNCIKHRLKNIMKIK